MLTYLCGREDLPAEPIENRCCHRHHRTVVGDRPIFDACRCAWSAIRVNLKIGVPAAGRVVLQTVLDLLTRYDKAYHVQRYAGGCLELA